MDSCFLSEPGLKGRTGKYRVYPGNSSHSLIIQREDPVDGSRT